MTAPKVTPEHRLLATEFIENWMPPKVFDGKLQGALSALIAQAVAAERERCWRIAETYWPANTDPGDEPNASIRHDAGLSIAAAIRQEPKS